MGCGSWNEVDALQVQSMVAACCRYFHGNPYHRWFGSLERMLSDSGASFYGQRRNMACHLDLVPYATTTKWGNLPVAERQHLVRLSAEPMGMLLRDSSLGHLILNGRSVVAAFEQVAGTDLEDHEMPEWDLPRSRGAPVKGYAYTGTIRSVGGVSLGRDIYVAGFNHNLQSSFGVTKRAIMAIGAWVADFMEPKR